MEKEWVNHYGGYFMKKGKQVGPYVNYLLIERTLG